MEVMTDLFTYIKDKNIAIDLNSKWFQELWYPLSKKTGSIITTRLLEWMGYSGEYKLQRQNLKDCLTIITFHMKKYTTTMIDF